MRLVRASATAAAAAVIISVAAAGPAVRAQDADQKVAGGGVMVKGWQGKADPGNKQGLTVKDSRFVAEGKGYRVTTGPAGFYWNPSNTAKGDYTVRATFREPAQTYSHPHPFGVFIGGSNLDSDKPSALYCVAYRNGNYLVRMFSEGSVVQVSGKPAPNEAVRKATAADQEVVQEIGWNVKGDRLECVVNGAVVWSGTKADVTGAGKLPSTDGVAGIRTSHNTDVIVSDFRVN